MEHAALRTSFNSSVPVLYAIICLAYFAEHLIWSLILSYVSLCSDVIY